MSVEEDPAELSWLLQWASQKLEPTDDPLVRT